MKTLSRFYAILLLIFLFSCDKDPEPGDPVSIPDGGFNSVLMNLGVDVDEDGSISYAEADHVTVLIIPGKGLTDLKGIEVFKNLESL